MLPIVASLVAAAIANGGMDRLPDFPPLRVTVVATTPVTGEFIRETLAEAAAIWRPVGVTLEWRRGTAHAADSAKDLTVVVEEELTRSPEGRATLGWIRFAGPDVPDPEIHLSRANAEDLVTRTASLHDKPAVFQDVVLARALGRALAHELGHYLLKSRAHAPRGLMQAVRPSIEFFSPDRAGFEITPEQQAWLAAHLPCAPEEAMR